MTRVSRRRLLRGLFPGKRSADADRELPDLEDELPLEPRFVVHFDQARCLPFMGPECGACMNLCEDGDNPTQALRLRRCRPLFAADFCNGCGLCIKACPVIPHALEIRPYQSTEDVENEQRRQPNQESRGDLSAED